MTNMRKAAIIAPNSLPVPPVRGGGIQNGIAEIIKHYRNYKPYVFSICEPGVDHLPLFEVDGLAEHHRIRLTSWEEFKINLTHLSRRNYFPYVLEICKQLKEIKPDIIHVRSRPWFLPILRKYLGKGIKIIEHNHNNYFMEMGRREVKGYLDLMDAFAGPSRFTVNAEVLSRFPEEANRCFVIYNGVNIDKFRPKWEKKGAADEVRKRLGIAQDDVVILFVGRLSKDKGVDVLVEAIKRIPDNLRKVKFLVVGSRFFGSDDKVTDFMKKLYESAKAISDKVIFTGFVPPDKINEIYWASDVLVVPSRMETFGHVYAEAGASGLPVVATKAGAIPEIVADGETGLLMDDPKNIDDLKDKIWYFIENPQMRRLFGERARKRMEENFTWETAARRTEAMYDKVLSS